MMLDQHQLSTAPSTWNNLSRNMEKLKNSKFHVSHMKEYLVKQNVQQFEESTKNTWRIEELLINLFLSLLTNLPISKNINHREKFCERYSKF